MIIGQPRPDFFFLMDFDFRVERNATDNDTRRYSSRLREVMVTSTSIVYGGIIWNLHREQNTQESYFQRGSKIQDRRPETRDPRPEIRDPRPETRDPRSKTQDPRSKIQDQRSKTKDPRPKTHDPRPAPRLKIYVDLGLKAKSTRHASFRTIRIPA